MEESISRQEDSGTELQWTGERFIPSLKGGIYYEHIHRYAFAAELCEGKICLDIASGEGFGANLLARRAQYVWGVDIDANSIAHSQRKYRRENLTFKAGSVSNIPLEDKSVDVVVSFETIEHSIEHQKFMVEVLRVLKTNGLLIISSPDKTQYTDLTGNTNGFHSFELYHADFEKLLRSHFQHVSMGKQRLTVGSFITPDHQVESSHSGVFSGDVRGTHFNEGVPQGVFSIAVCSNANIPAYKHGIFEDPQFLSGQEALEVPNKFDSIQAQLEKLTIERNTLAQALAAATTALEVANQQKSQALTELAIAINEIKEFLVDKTENQSWIKRLFSKSREFEFNLEKGKRILSESGLFDREYYSTNNPDVVEAGRDPLEHYLSRGWKEGRRPSKQFDPVAYFKANRDLDPARTNPLLHYASHRRK